MKDEIPFISTGYKINPKVIVADRMTLHLAKDIESQIRSLLVEFSRWSRIHIRVAQIVISRRPRFSGLVGKPSGAGFAIHLNANCCCRLVLREKGRDLE